MIHADIAMIGPGLFEARVPAHGLVIRSRHPETALCRRPAQLGYGHAMLQTLRDGIPALRMPIGVWAGKVLEEDGRLATSFRVRSTVEAPHRRETDPAGRLGHDELQGASTRMAA